MPSADAALAPLAEPAAAAVRAAEPLGPIPAPDSSVDLRKLLIIFAVMLGTLLEIIDSSIVNVALPDMMGSLGATLDEIGWVITGYIISNVVVIPMTAWLAARFGRRRYFTTSILVFTAASFFCGFAHTLTELVVFRVIQGLGGGALLSTSQTIMTETFPRTKQGMAQAIFGVGVMLGPSLGPTLGGWITDNYTWPWIFYVNVPLGLLAAFVSATFLEEPTHLRRVDSVDWPGIALLVIGVGCLQTVLERGERNDWFESQMIVTLAVVAGSALVLFLVRELTAEHPVVDFRVLRHRALWVGCILGCASGVGIYGSIFLLPVYTQNLLGWSAWDAGMAILPSSIATAISMTIAGRLVMRIGPAPLLGFGMLVFMAGLVGMAHWTLQSGYDDLFWPQVARGVGLGFMFVPISTATLGGIPVRDVAQGAGLYNLCRQLAGSFGIAVLATALDRRGTVHHAYLSEKVSLLDPQTVQRAEMMARGLMARGLDLAHARRAAAQALDGILQAQAGMLAFEDCYHLVLLVFLLLIPLVFLVRTPRAQEAIVREAVVHE